MRAIGYVRVSTDDQAQSGVSLEAQEEKIRAYCLAKSWDLLRVIRDGGYSAKDSKSTRHAKDPESLQEEGF